MSRNRAWLWGCTHLRHAKMYSAPFRRADGTPLRPFTSSDEADQAMLENHNALVRPGDKVYWLGDILLGNVSDHEFLRQFHGTKVLVKGNHDKQDIGVYRRYFKDVRAIHRLAGLVLTHIPIHPMCIREWRGEINVHAHIHDKRVLGPDGLPDPLYETVSVEHTGYAPICLDDLLERLRPRLDATEIPG